MDRHRWFERRRRPARRSHVEPRPRFWPWSPWTVGDTRRSAMTTHAPPPPRLTRKERLALAGVAHLLLLTPVI
ncbi:hypothetical protein SDRG_04762 [Saprolegnia diclina VS20]|uniref:Uncharacterized protein n=1 Tax=Saprolegnia diclina (strain VS20) TaxID=1156394 RepID=T0QUM8_SAPDV|nr:hypothetical protein SDRG_04762 [Saprolegnia diclina VS20]EQC37735.1 hypothetical protein SDRG_04762 [Saprolegnia diclina VS20]|eukprot:XP_008608668.1 hypothetical protein SDRG_04762 [Saprolegnia diclina VS20]